MFKNTTGQNWRVFAFLLSNGTPVTGDAANITAKISKDGGAFASLTDTNPTERESGYYDFDLTQAETNADTLALIPVSATTGVQVVAIPHVELTFPSDILLTKKLLEADVIINTTTTPWQVEFYESGTSTLLMTKQLTDETDTNVTTKSQFIASKVAP